jgi:hypothetical protein
VTIQTCLTDSTLVVLNDVSTPRRSTARRLRQTSQQLRQQEQHCPALGLEQVVEQVLRLPPVDGQAARGRRRR